MKKLWFMDYLNNKEWESTDLDSYIKVNQCLQEILMWRGECSFNVNLGIDYQSIFSGGTFLTPQIEEILDRYRKFFKDIILEVIQENQKIVFVNLQFWFNSDINANLNSNLTKKGEPISSMEVKLKLTKEGLNVATR